MPLFETKIPINEEEVAKLVHQHWGIKLQKILKASQNHTFSAVFESTGNKCCVRVTPDPQKIHYGRIKDELTFVKYCADHKLHHVCAPVPVKGESKDLCVKEGDLIVAVFEWAKGQPINFFELTWMSDVPLIKAWGRYFAEMHKISKQFSAEHPEIAKRIQNWNQIHHGVLSKIELSPEDKKDVDNPKCFGVIHGDLNTSNSYYDREGDFFSVYDTDQTQRGFYEWDLAQAVFGVVMLKEAGMPISGDPVPQANREFFEENLIKGYESVAGEGAIDRSRLARMIEIKKEFYRLFCTQAIEEGDIPKDMEAFIHFIAKSFNKLDQKKKEEVKGEKEAEKPAETSEKKQEQK